MQFLDKFGLINHLKIAQANPIDAHIRLKGELWLLKGNLITNLTLSGSINEKLEDYDAWFLNQDIAVHLKVMQNRSRITRENEETSQQISNLKHTEYFADYQTPDLPKLSFK